MLSESVLDKQPPQFDQSLPIDPIGISANYFSLDCLEFSFHCLREEHPSLALIVQNLLAETRTHHCNNSRDKLIQLELDVQAVSDIVTALSEVAEHAAQSEEHGKEEMIAIHQTLLDWLLYAQSFLDTINPLAIEKNITK